MLSKRFGSGLRYLICSDEMLSPAARARSTASRIGPCVEPQPTSRTLPSGGPGTFGTGTVAWRASSFLRRLATMAWCILGALVGWPASSCSRPVATGYLPLAMRVPGTTRGTTPSGVDKSYGVKSIFDVGRRQHDAGRVAMAAEAGDVQIGLLDAGRQAGGRPAALDIHNHQRHFGHDRPTQRFTLQGNPGAAGTGDRNASGITRSRGQ